MADNRNDPPYGRVEQLSPLVRRVLAHNPSPFTGTGTGTYIVGHGTVAILDPGPNDAAHLGAVAAAVAGETVSHLLVTHTHLDHSPGALPLQAKVGGLIAGCAPLAPAGDDPRSEEHTSELQSRCNLVCRLLLEKKKKNI